MKESYNVAINAIFFVEIFAQIALVCKRYNWISNVATQKQLIVMIKIIFLRITARNKLIFHFNVDILIKLIAIKRVRLNISNAKANAIEN